VLVYHHNSMKTISFVNLKGGVGKTSICLNLAAAVSKRGRRVLLLDLDPSASLTYSLLENVETAAPRYPDDWTRAVVPFNHYDLVPGSLELEDLEKKKDLHILKQALQQAKGYDFVFIDCPPALDVLTIMAILASSTVCAVINARLLEYRGLVAIDDTIRALRAKARRKVIVNEYDGRRRLEQDLLKKLKKDYGEDLYRSTVRRSVAVPESVVRSMDVLAHRRTSPVAKDFEALAREFLRKEG